jgi:hypothetical protein
MLSPLVVSLCLSHSRPLQGVLKQKRLRPAPRRLTGLRLCIFHRTLKNEIFDDIQSVRKLLYTLRS